MALGNLKKHYSYFFENNKDLSHFTAHSHHPWPDCTLDGHKQYWLDSAKLTDKKWPYLFGEVIKNAQVAIAQNIKWPDHELIVFEPNVHCFVNRLLSCVKKEAGRQISILTTDSEFLSFDRQIKRLEEDQLVDVTRIPTAPYSNFTKRFQHAVADSTYDFIYISQTFYNSGFFIPCSSLEEIASLIPTQTIFAIDGYHSFFTRPLDFSKLSKNTFFLAGGYKYAQSGEGCCFLAIPPGTTLRPRNTGWFAHFDGLDQKQAQISYAPKAGAFAGATFDPSGIYRFNSIIKWMDDHNITMAQVHIYVSGLMTYFMSKLEKSSLFGLKSNDLIQLPHGHIGHFLTFQRDDAAKLYEVLNNHSILVDFRGTKLRFGFGIYQSKEDIDLLWQKP